MQNLGVPIPKVYSWSSRAQEKAVGAECILIEKLSSTQLSSIWAEIKGETRLAILKAITGYQNSWTAFTFNQYGSLYFREDLAGPTQELSYTNSQGITDKDLRFTVGPSTGRELRDDGRLNVKFDRGLCESEG